MPRDQWAKANSRAKYGAAPRPESGGKKIKAFVVPARTACEIRKSEGYFSAESGKLELRGDWC